MAVKRSSPITGRSPSVLPIIDHSDSSTMMMIDSDKTPRSILLKPLRTRDRTLKSSLLRKLPIDLVIAIMVWYLLGVGCICTSKMLLTEYSLPPLVLTFQQLLLGSSILRVLLSFSIGVQPLPEDNLKTRLQNGYSIYFDFVLMGLFNMLDFLASNTSFSHSAASFVETIKASEPITTTCIALFFGIDTIRISEALSMGILIVGVFCATVGNSQRDQNGASDAILTPEEEELKLHQSVKTAVIVMTANLCFALRAKSQKIFRSHPEGLVMNDANLLMRMHQIGAFSLLLPVIIFELPGGAQKVLDFPLDMQGQYWFLATANAVAFFSYSLASCYVLTKLSVVQYTMLNCLRRMFAVISTSIAFGVPLTPLGATGIVLCFCGFGCFNHVRTKPKNQNSQLPPRAPSLSRQISSSAQRSIEP